MFRLNLKEEKLQFDDLRIKLITDLHTISKFSMPSNFDVGDDEHIKESIYDQIEDSPDLNQGNFQFSSLLFHFWAF